MLKRYSIFLILLFVTLSYAGGNSACIKLGFFNPSATDAGFIIGYEGSRYIDEYFNIGWSIDWFHKNYVDKALVNEFNSIPGVSAATNELRAKTNLHEVPLMFLATAKFPAGKRLKVFLSGGFGAEVLMIFYRNYQNPDDDEFQALFDFSWRIGTGVIYELGTNSDIIGELGYHSSAPSWEYEVTDALGQKRVFSREFDMSGLMLRAGVRFYF